MMMMLDISYGMKPVTLHLHLGHLADAFIQIDLQ